MTPLFRKRNSPDYPYTVRRSARRSIGIQITDGGVLVRAPRRAGQKEIEAALLRNDSWIRAQLAKREHRRQEAEAAGILTESDLQRLKQEAKEYIPRRVAHFAPLAKVTPGRITIRAQKTRWGSCSGKGNLNFNCLLMLTPPEVIDSVVVHELCHLKEMNHSARFYAEVRRVCPEYDRWNRWLKEHGPMIMERMKMAENGR